MGDVQLMSGALTCGLMLAAPWLFKTLGWAATLGVTPKSAMILGWAFFGFSIWMAAGGFLVQTSPWLPYLVWGGSILYVIERAAKFSLFKPAEEMVYITLDEESRTKGKAAVDVLGAQVGKTGGSFLQQGLLLWCGTIVAALPALMIGHSAVVVMWLWAVKRLDDMHGAELEKMHEEAPSENEKRGGRATEKAPEPSPPRDDEFFFTRGGGGGILCECIPFSFANRRSRERLVEAASVKVRASYATPPRPPLCYHLFPSPPVCFARLYPMAWSISTSVAARSPWKDMAPLLARDPPAPRTRLNFFNTSAAASGPPGSNPSTTVTVFPFFPARVTPTRTSCVAAGAPALAPTPDPIVAEGFCFFAVAAGWTPSSRRPYR